MLFRHYSVGDGRVGFLHHSDMGHRRNRVGVIRVPACVPSSGSSPLCLRTKTPGLKIASSRISGSQQARRPKEDGLYLYLSVSSILS